MARVDSILSILVHEGANELRLGTDREPRLLSRGTAKRLSVPSTPEDTLRELLGEILDAQREESLRSRGHAELTYEAAGIGTFQVRLSARAGGFDAVFLHDARGALAPAAPLLAEVAPARATGTAAAAPPTPAQAARGGTAVASPRAAETGPASTGSLDLARTAPSPASFRTTSAVGEPMAQLTAHAVALRASDLHLVDGEPPVARVDGRLRRLGEHPVDLRGLIALSREGEAALARGLSVDMAIDVPGGGRARVHAFRSAEGLAVAIRLVPATAPRIAALHIPVPLQELVDLPHGLVIVCGATGSGKSTTLAALAQEALERRSIALVTLEDPIEHTLVAPDSSIVRRREVGRDASDFATGLRDALREDPDVILLGEMRDPETISLALTAAETGHLVLSSLHSRSAASAIERIVDAYPPERQQQVRVQLADSLRAVVAQRLLPRAQGAGRVPVVEVLRVTHAVAAIVREGKTAQIATALQSGKREGMISLERCLADRVRAGEVRLEDARAAANDADSLAMYLAK